MVQDWGYNYIYLRFEISITKVNLENHSHRDVTHMPMEAFNSASLKNSNASKEQECENIWICSASKASMIMNGLEWCRDVMDEAYVPIPFPKEKLKPLK